MGRCARRSDLAKWLKIRSTGESKGLKRTLLALTVLLVGGAAAAGAYFWMNTEKPVPTAAQSNGEKVKAEMQKAEREAAAKAPPAESTPPEVTPTRGARGVK